MSFGARFLVVKVPSTKQPLSCSLVLERLRRAVSRATFSPLADVLMIVLQRDSSGRKKVPSVNVGSSINAALTFGSFISIPRSTSWALRFSIPSSNFSPMNRRKTRVSIMSRFSKKEPEFFALRRMSRHLKRISSMLSGLSDLVFAFAIFFTNNN